GFDSFTIHINNRKILNGFFDSLNIKNKTDVLRIIDKLDKIGLGAVKEELSDLGIENSALQKIIEFINIEGTNDEILNALNKLNISNETFKTGLDELAKVCYYIKCFDVPESNFIIDLKIARGLDYYTGTVYETILNDYPSIGSVCSGGRYDNLAEYYTNQKLPGVGISIGLTRLFYQFKEANIIADNGTSTPSAILVISLDDNLEYTISVANKLIKNNINADTYLEEGKVSKKLNYADKLGVTYVILIGSEERETNILTLKEHENRRTI
ncbi:MAG TPA: histidine--tRNA ligase, partial [Clostridiaceae bacterium]|nr:histidine--tRNA ligase [Clostridiaceae bacterium]